MSARTLENESGFTLIDMLVAMTVTGLAGSLLIGLFSFIERDAERARAQVEIHDDLVAIGSVFRSLTEEAHLSPREAEGIIHPHGTASAFTIPSLGPRVLSLARPALFTLKSENEGQRKRMVLSWKETRTGHERREALGSLIDGAEFAYFGAMERDGVRAWQPNWDASARNLEAIRLTLRPSALQAPLEIVMPLRADLAVECIRNPHRIHCSARQP
ncbi:type II secretion system protein [Microvirga sp. 2YAF29]|uniref:type II secretion system protein n=1 Tax=Microvirga sp. 2YAF29 TaxID=3233031 RepID=UPI003F965A73